MRFELTRLGFALIFAALLLCGCVRIDIGDEQEPPTIGQQLIDLAQAHRKGVISDEEFEEIRNRLIAASFE